MGNQICLLTSTTRWILHRSYGNFYFSNPNPLSYFLFCFILHLSFVLLFYASIIFVSLLSSLSSSVSSRHHLSKIFFSIFLSPDFSFQFLSKSFFFLLLLFQLSFTYICPKTPLVMKVLCKMSTINRYGDIKLCCIPGLTKLKVLMRQPGRFCMWMSIQKPGIPTHILRSLLISVFKRIGSGASIVAHTVNSSQFSPSLESESRLPEGFELEWVAYALAVRWWSTSVPGMWGGIWSWTGSDFALSR